MRLSLGLHLVCSLAVAAACTPTPDVQMQLRILETTDLHMHIVDYDYFQDQPAASVGLARTAALLKAARAEVANSVSVDNGDLLQGNPLDDFMARERGLREGDNHPAYKGMNLLDYTVGKIGNHEFNYGLDERSSAGKPRGTVRLAGTVVARGARVLAGATPHTVRRYTQRQQKGRLSVAPSKV